MNKITLFLPFFGFLSPFSKKDTLIRDNGLISNLFSDVCISNDYLLDNFNNEYIYTCVVENDDIFSKSLSSRYFRNYISLITYSKTYTVNYFKKLKQNIVNIKCGFCCAILQKYKGSSCLLC